MVLSNFLFYMIFGGQIWYFKQLIRGTKVVLWFGEGQKYEFLSCPLPPVCVYLKQFYKSNTRQLELFCSVLHFLANQTHPNMKIVVDTLRNAKKH